ncbi:probable elongator complex protein 2 [Belonocnema kinseyi]|uniref:probable elongator complex protein 2 n=1 Tax=Belonocnema kinseyi TaxID=2817044 RepID=UPI00143CD0D0|nr:probable elongator complex protein 2 [Belonocnema kinseyi]
MSLIFRLDSQLSRCPKHRFVAHVQLFLVTASVDQTTRIHAPWSDESDVWHEIARPQIHGYDISCLTMLSSYKFASGAEEKVVRIFKSTLTFKTCLDKISYADDFGEELVEGASLPALGLMNKAIFGQDLKGNKPHIGSLNDLTYDRPPVEEELIQHTLWSEEQKLYGHGYEIFTMAAKHDGTLLATVCKSTNSKYAAILIWDTKTWMQVQQLISHQLTVTQLAFSPDDKYLVSVSRDRQWSLFGLNERRYNLLATSLKKDNLHNRIIWCCAWTHDSKYFATGSRDGKIGIWSENVSLSQLLLPTAILEIKDSSVTALSFAPIMLSANAYILAVGFDSGEIEIFNVVLQNNQAVWESLAKYDSSFAHHLTVKRLQFRPQSKSEKKMLYLASCGSDHTVKIYNIDVS